MAELADAQDSGSCEHLVHAGSSPVVRTKIKSRHFCRNSKCRLFCRPKMCYNVIMKEVLDYLRRWGFELYKIDQGIL